MNKKEKLTFCTIIARNYLAQARVLVESINTHHPLAQVNVLVIDAKQNELQEVFPITTLQDIAIADVEQLAFKYTLTEFATAVKPFYIDFLFQTTQTKQIIYLDPDCKLFSPLQEVKKLLQEQDIILTPHITTPYTDTKNPSERTILRSGPYNLGFLALRNNTNTKKFLLWWQEKLYHHCYMRGNLFVDQKWLIMAESMFERVYILKHPGYNVAYWNLHERSIKQQKQLLCNNKPLRFFHFSGFQPTCPEHISFHQNRFQFQHLNKEVKNMFKTYQEELFAKQYLKTRNINYRFNYYQNKKRITTFERKLFVLQQQKGHQPFHTQKNSFYRYVRRGFFLKELFFIGLIDILFRTKKILFDKIITTLLGKAKTKQLKDFLVKKNPFEKKIYTLYQQKPAYGINIYGYHTTESGMGESARTLTKTIQKTTIPHVLNNDTSTNSRQQANLQPNMQTYNKYDHNIIVVNGDRFKKTINELGKAYFTQRTTIAYWTWELNTLPKTWPANHPVIDAFWVPSTFVQQTLQKKTTKPIQVIPHSISSSQKKVVSKRKQKPFTFLFMFDFYSYVERKNPFAVIDAFKQAFDKQEPVQLIIKCINETYNIKAFLQLQEAAKQHSIIILNTYLSKPEVEELIQTCDCYVSLHRSEGFGLTIAEAMACEKPVIVTAYSGNMDFCNEKNSYLVGGTLKTIKKNYGPYTKGNVWAEPNCKVAATYMRQVYENKKEAKEKAKQARKTITRHHSPKTVASIVQKQLKQLHQKEDAENK